MRLWGSGPGPAGRRRASPFWGTVGYVGDGIAGSPYFIRQALKPTLVLLVVVGVASYVFDMSFEDVVAMVSRVVERLAELVPGWIERGRDFWSELQTA